MPWLRFGPWVGARVASQHCPIFRPSRLDFNKMKLVSHWNRNSSLDSFYIAGVDATVMKNGAKPPLMERTGWLVQLPIIRGLNQPPRLRRLMRLRDI
jgi:hypothetical protein